MSFSTNNAKIGIFDSGIGGTSIFKEINALLPNESTLYLSDSKHAPYGQKSIEEIVALSIKNTEFLLANNCKIIIVACNTATTNAIKVLRTRYNIPFIGIEPAIKPAALQTITNTIGILATKGTLNSQLFAETSNKLQEKITIVEQVGEGLVELIENGKLKSTAMTELLKKHLQPFVKNNVDCLVLGCTHYPYLIPQIKKLIGHQIQIIDSGQAVAKQTKNVLKKLHLLAPKNTPTTHVFYSNKNTEPLQYVLSSFSKAVIKKVAF